MKCNILSRLVWRESSVYKEEFISKDTSSAQFHSLVPSYLHLNRSKYFDKSDFS